MSKRPSLKSSKLAEEARLRADAERRDQIRNAALAVKIEAAQGKTLSKDRGGIVSNHVNSSSDESKVANQMRMDKEELQRRHMNAFEVASTNDQIEDARSVVLQEMCRQQPKPVDPPSAIRKHLLDLLHMNIISQAIGGPVIENRKQELLSSKESELRDLQDRLPQLTESKGKLDARIAEMRRRGEQWLISKQEKQLFIDGNNKEVKDAIIQCNLSLVENLKTIKKINLQLTELCKGSPSPGETKSLIAIFKQNEANVKSDQLRCKELEEKESAYLVQVSKAQEELVSIFNEYHKELDETKYLFTEATSKQAEIDIVQGRIVELEKEIVDFRQIMPSQEPSTRRSRATKRKTETTDACRMKGGEIRMCDAVEDGGGCWASSSHDEVKDDTEDWILNSVGDGYVRELTPETSEPSRYIPEFRSLSPKPNDWDDVDFGGLSEFVADSPDAAKQDSLTSQSVGLAVANTDHISPKKSEESEYTIGNGPPPPPARWLSRT